MQLFVSNKCCTLTNVLPITPIRCSGARFWGALGTILCLPCNRVAVHLDMDSSVVLRDDIWGQGPGGRTCPLFCFWPRLPVRFFLPQRETPALYHISRRNRRLQPISHQHQQRYRASTRAAEEGSKGLDRVMLLTSFPWHTAQMKPCAFVTLSPVEGARGKQRSRLFRHTTSVGLSPEGSLTARADWAEEMEWPANCSRDYGPGIMPDWLPCPSVGADSSREISGRASPNGARARYFDRNADAVTAKCRRLL